MISTFKVSSHPLFHFINYNMHSRVRRLSNFKYVWVDVSIISCALTPMEITKCPRQFRNSWKQLGCCNVVLINYLFMTSIHMKTKDMQRKISFREYSSPKVKWRYTCIGYSHSHFKMSCCIVTIVVWWVIVTVWLLRLVLLYKYL